MRLALREWFARNGVKVKRKARSIAETMKAGHRNGNRTSGFIRLCCCDSC